MMVGSCAFIINMLIPRLAILGFPDAKTCVHCRDELYLVILCYLNKSLLLLPNISCKSVDNPIIIDILFYIY